MSHTDTKQHTSKSLSLKGLDPIAFAKGMEDESNDDMIIAEDIRLAEINETYRLMLIEMASSRNEEYFLYFTTKGDDAEKYTNDLVNSLMRIEEFAEKIHEKETFVLNDTMVRVKLTFGLDVDDDDVMDDPAIREVHQLLQHEERVMNVYIDARHNKASSSKEKYRYTNMFYHLPPKAMTLRFFQAYWKIN